MNEQMMYEASEIVFEGELEIQAGSPLSIPEVPEFEKWEW